MKKYTGISITNEFIRIAEAEIETGKVKAVRLREIAIQKNGNIGNLNDIKFLKKIKGELKKEKLFNKAFISLNSKDVIVKDKIVPPIKRNDIFKLIESEIKDYAIFSHQNVSLGFNIIEKAKDKIKIIWAGTKEETLFNTIKSFRKAGIKSVGVIPSNFAVGKFVTEFYEKESPVVIINVDSTSTTLTFMQNGKVLYTYVQDIGFNEMENQNTALQNNWVGNILTTITYVARNRNLVIEKAYLISQKDVTKDLTNLLSKRLPYPIITARIPEGITFKNEEDYLRIQKNGGVEFAEAVGLALFGERSTKDPLFCDISKHILVEKKSMGVKIATTIILLVLINGAAFYFYPYINSTLTSLQTNISNTESKITIASKAAEKTTNLKNELSALDGVLSQYKVVKSDLDNRAITAALLTEIKAKLPKGVIVNSVSVNSDGKISISGTGPSYKAILDYEVNLSTAKYVENTTIHSMSKGLTSTTTFSMSADVKGVKNEKK